MLLSASAYLECGIVLLAIENQLLAPYQASKINYRGTFTPRNSFA